MVVDVGGTEVTDAKAVEREQARAREVLPPARLDHAAFRLRPFGPEHNERAHVAWMRSIDHIRATPGYPDGREH